MDDKKNKVIVEIFGESYPIKSDGEVAQIERIAAIVDSRMKKIARTNSLLSPAKVAVLAALNLADEYEKLQGDYQELMQILKNEKNYRQKK